MSEWRIESPTSLDLTGVRRLEVRLVEGNVDVVGRTEDAADGAASLEVTRVDGPLLVSLDGTGTLSITHEKLTWGGLLQWGGRGRARAIVSVSVPATCPVELGVVSADAVVSGIEATKTAVKSVSGDVTLDDVRSDIAAQTVSGDLETRQLAGDLTFSSVSGDLTVAGGRCSSLRAETVSGDVTLDVDLERSGRLNVSSVSGDVTVRLPRDTGTEVDVKSMSGTLESAFGGLDRERKPGTCRLRGIVGDGSGSLAVKTVSGDVTLLRRATP